MACCLKLPYVSIIPEGVMGSQLRAQLDGLSGHIGGLFPDLDANNAWLGGTEEAWERGPYYLSGLIPLAFLTQDQQALDQMHRWVEAILAGQREDGNFGPERDTDWWPRMIVLKAFAGYFRATEDVRILDFFEKYFRFQYDRIDGQPLYFWASARAFEAMEAIELLYAYRPMAFLTGLAEKLRLYSYDFFSLFENFPYTEPMTSYISRPLFRMGKYFAGMLDEHGKKSRKIKPSPDRESILRFNRGKTVSLIMKTHGVNLAMALKYPATYGDFTGRPELPALCRKGYEELFRFHGNSTGLFSCDEHLMGTSPAQGIELCAVVEMMYSLEEIGRVTMDPWAFELLEFIAYNAFPAMFTPDMTAHQYVQQPNQTACDTKRRPFFDTDRFANTFGIAPNYGCCTANMHAGFPLFAGYLALRCKEGFVFPVYGACTVKTSWNGGPLEIRETGNYPFTEQITFSVVRAEGEVGLYFRPVSNTEFSISCNGKTTAGKPDAKGMIGILAKEGDVIEIHCPPICNTVTNPDGSKSIRYGNLLMAMGLEAREIYIKGRAPFHDRGFVSQDSFNKTPAVPDGHLHVTDIMKKPVCPLPFAEPAVRLKVEGRIVSGCRMKRNNAWLPLPAAEVSEEKTMLTLVPYGSSRLRISHFPRPAGMGQQ